MDNSRETSGKFVDPLVELPLDVISNILKRVLTKDLKEYRLVSKSWKHMISISLGYLLHASEEAVLLHHHSLLNIPIAKRRERSFLSIFNPKKNVWEKRWLPWMWSAYRIVAADRGLVFFLTNDHNHQLAVYNLVTQTYREMILPHEFRPPHERLLMDDRNLLTAIFVDKTTGVYKLLLAGLLSGVTLLYDSACCRWRVSAPIPSSSRDNIASFQIVGDNKSIVLNECLYWGFLCLRRWKFFKMVLKFDIKHERWCRAELPAPPLWQFQIAVCSNKIMTMNLQHDYNWPLPYPAWLQDARIKNIGPEFKVPPMTQKMLDPIKKEQRNNGRNYCGEYYGIGCGEKFFHVMRGSRQGIRIAVQNTTTFKHTLLRLWRDSSNGKANCKDFWAILPSFQAQP